MAEIDTSSLPNFAQQDYEVDRSRGSRNEDLSVYIPSDVQDYLNTFYNAVDKGDEDAILTCYDTQFKRFTEKFFKDSRWPEEQHVAQLVGDHDGLFINLYKELYYRHLYMSLQPTLEDRFASYDNYIELFNELIDCDTPVNLTLPPKWIWDIIDEFIYQFQDFVLYRGKVAEKTDEEKELLRDAPQIWNVHIVLNTLHSLIVKTKINDQLAAYKNNEDPTKVAGTFGAEPLYKMLGYFSLVGLLRLQCLLGDYRQALQVMANVELHTKGLYSRVPACQITIYHYVGFCYLMLRRYQDALRSFEAILLYIQATQSFHSKSHQAYDVISRKRDHICSILALTYALCPQRLEDQVLREMNEKEGDAIRKVQANGEDTDEALNRLFMKGCPRFLTAAPVDYASPPSSDDVQKAYEHQLQLFRNDVKQQCLLSTIRSYLHLYKSMKLSKLASFLNLSEKDLRVQLHAYKHKMAQLTWSTGSPLEGDRACADSLDFYIDNDMIRIASVTVAKCYGDDFLAKSLKMISTFQGKTGKK